MAGCAFIGSYYTHNYTLYIVGGKCKGEVIFLQGMEA
jgi:hypothetical protein